jgi:hypothetical protein
MSSPTFSHVGTPTFAAHSLVSGHIEVIFGPMFSGKSSELLRRIQRFTIAQKKCLVIKYVADTRYSQNQMCVCATASARALFAPPTACLTPFLCQIVAPSGAGRRTTST